MSDYAVVADNGGSDQRYRDIVGEVYTFPNNYAKILTEGTKFVYQRCGSGSMRVPEPDRERLLDESHYFGTAEIGRVTDIGNGLFEAEIINYKHFVRGVPFRLQDGSHFEVAPGQFWRNGVRATYKEVYDEIAKAGFGTIPNTSPLLVMNLVPLQVSSIPTNNKRKTATNRSSVQFKSELTCYKRSSSFANDTLQLVTARDGYWLYSLVYNQYFRLSPIRNIDYDMGELIIGRGLVSRDPNIYDDRKYSLSHRMGDIKILIGTIEIHENHVRYNGPGTSVKTLDKVEIPWAIAL